jgi:hypothetical protein
MIERQDRDMIAETIREDCSDVTNLIGKDAIVEVPSELESTKAESL